MTRHLLFSLLIFPSLTALFASCDQNSTPVQPNIILITIDTLRSDYLGAYSPEKKLTPFMDRLSREGVFFRNAIAPSSWTKPSVASLLTGLYPGRHGAVLRTGVQDKSRSEGRFSLDPGFTTLAESLKAAGYNTAAFITNPNLISALHFDQGFDDFTQPAGIAEELLGQALKWIESEGGKGKFYLHLHLLDPHLPYYPPEEYRNRYAAGSPGEQAPFAGNGSTLGIEIWLWQYKAWRRQAPGESFEFDFEKSWDTIRAKHPQALTHLDLEEARNSIFLDFKDLDDPILKQRLEHLIALYRGEVAYSDDALSFFMETLQKSGVLENSVVVVTADHGEAFLEHEELRHDRTVHAEEVNIPFIFRLPESMAAQPIEIDDPVSLVDIYPTILDLLGLPVPQGLDGISLWPAIRNPDGSLKRNHPVITELLGDRIDHVAALIPGKKLIRVAERGDEIKWQYYDTTTDPGESKPLDITEEDNTVRSLKQVISNWIKNRTLGGDSSEDGGTLSESELEQMRQLGYL